MRCRMFVTLPEHFRLRLHPLDLPVFFENWHSVARVPEAEGWLARADGQHLNLVDAYRPFGRFLDPFLKLHEDQIAKDFELV